MTADTAAAQVQVDEQTAKAYFAEAAALCEAEGGRLWGVSLCGPMVFADAATRSMATSQPAPAGDRPFSLGFIQAPIDWSGTRWSAYVWTIVPAADRQLRGRLLIHELFHRVQPQLGLMLLGKPNDHLDTLDGRYWLRLEWRALARALGASGPERLDSTRDALTFRAARRARFPGAAESERVDEIREGLAQYTGTVVSFATPEAAIAAAVRELSEAEKAPTFVRTFGYPSGTAYGLLLDVWTPGWTRLFLPSEDLGARVMAAAKLPIVTGDAAAAATRYGSVELRIAEEQRDKEQQARVVELRRRFVEGPVLVVPRGRNSAINTTGVTPIPGEGTVFFEYRTTGEWGQLESKGGLLVSAEGGTLKLQAPFRVDDATLGGDGWTITLAPGWVASPGPRPGDFQVVRR